MIITSALFQREGNVWSRMIGLGGITLGSQFKILSKPEVFRGFCLEIKLSTSVGVTYCLGDYGKYPLKAKPRLGRIHQS